MRIARTLTVPLVTGLVVMTLSLVGCGGGGGGGGTNPDPDPDPTPVMDHTNIVLKDRWGNPLQADSTEPYSPRQTCGACHDVDAIANGYHFQQGRTDKDSNVQCREDFFGDGRDWLKSDGMYGKW